MNGGLELYRLSVQARGNRIAGGHVQGARGPFAAGRPGGTARPVESEDAEPAAVERLAKSAPALTAAGVGVVRHQDDGGVGVDNTEVVDKAHAGQFGARTQHLGRGLEERARLRIAIALPLHGRPVHTERHVVEKRAPVHVAEVDGPFERIGERVERPDEVIRVQAQVAGEVVSGPGRNAYERDSMGGCGGRHDRQRSVSARHAEYVGPARRSLGCEGAEVVARPQDDRLDPPFTSRLDKPGPSSPAAAGLQIDEEHGLPRGVSAGPSHLQVMTPPADSHAALRPPAWADELDRLDAAVYAAIAATPTPAMDMALRRLSRAANHSRLWLGCSALLAACGGERGRRAAENGLASIALTSAVVNLVLKPLGNRRRPDRQIYDVPVTRQVAMPRSTSWPSGHSASAFAFASGVSAAWPQAGIPLSVVASLVAYSRVHTGVHYPSDTIAGTASGVALAPVAVAALERRRSARG